ncbi:MAG: hypothetical protein ACOY3P_07295 [Planctomycetota bacterium]
MAQQSGSQLGDLLAQKAQEARNRFRPITDQELAAEVHGLRAAVGRLKNRIALDGENGKAWAEYLRLSELQQAIDMAAPDTARLTDIYRRFTSGHEGLGLIHFTDVRSGLRRYLQKTNARRNPAAQEEYRAMMDALAERLRSHAARPNLIDAAAIGPAVGWLVENDQAPEVVRLVQENFKHPNFEARVSAGLLSAGLGESIDDVGPVRDCILGTTIYGTAHTTGRTLVDLPANDDFGVVDLLMFGEAASRNRGYNGPATIYNNSRSQLAARKRIWITADGLRSYPSVARVNTSTNIYSIQARSGLVERIAWRRACQQKGQAEGIASRHAEQRLNERIDSRAEEALARANESYVEKFRQPLGELGLFPDRLQFRTEPSRLTVVSLQTDAGQLAAPGLPPLNPVDADLQVRVHESMVNNSVATALGGMTLSEESLRRDISNWLGRVPERLQEDPQEELLSVYFAEERPLTVEFRDNRIAITVRGLRYEKDGETYPGMEVVAVYAIEQKSQGFTLRREGELDIHPPGFDPGSGQRLSARQVTIRTILKRRFDKLFEPEIAANGFVPEGEWAKVGRLVPTMLRAEDGWLQVAWQRHGAAALPMAMTSTPAE